MTEEGTHRCRACAADVPAEAARCPKCSAAQGPFEPCPHCRAEAGASRHAELRFVCDVCGGPRTPRLDLTIKYGGREIAPLRKAEAARRGRAGWRAAAIASGLLVPIALLFFGVLALIFGIGFGLILATLVVVGPIVAFLVMALARARRCAAEIPPAIDAAWIAVASDVAAQTPTVITAEILARRLGIEEPQAEELVALLDVNELVGGPRLRVAPGSVDPAAPTQVASAEEEAAIAEQAATEAQALQEPGKVR